MRRQGGFFMRSFSFRLSVSSLALGLVFAIGCGSNVESLFSNGQTTGGAQGGFGGQGGAGQGGLGGLGGLGGAMSSSSSSAQASSASASSASSTSASTGGFDPQACATCGGQACLQEILACGQACQAFAGCAQNCMDQACIQGCLAQTPQAKPVYDCTCAACPGQCGAICGGGSGSTTSSSSTGGGPACATCGQILQGSQDPPCQGSDTLAQDLFVCTCQTGCANECAQTCQMGAQPSQTCFGCIQSKCGTQFNACLQD
jgi:hypothetical protein